MNCAFNQKWLLVNPLIAGIAVMITTPITSKDSNSRSQ